MTPLEMTRLAGELGVGNPDVLLVGDGSGTVMARPAGWFTWAYLPARQLLLEVSGAFSHGTNNLVELYPYLHAMLVVQTEGIRPPARVVVVSDSEVTVRIGQGKYQPSANRALWAAYRQLQAEGYAFEWRWIRRCSVSAHVQADDRSRQARRAWETHLGFAARGPSALADGR